MAEEGHKVSLHVYDLSQGLARQLSMSFLGKTIEAIWHTGVVVYGREYYFGRGIQEVVAGTAPYGTPMRVVDLGITHIPKDVFEMYLQEITPRYTAETYSLMTHNCNNFSSEITQFLVGTNIPEYILNLPNEVTSSPMAALIMPMIQNLETTMRAGAVPQAPQFRQSPVINQVNQSTESSKIQPKSKDQTSDANAKVGAVVDPLGEARSKLQEEIGKEFAAIMATGAFRASEAAALATRKVMQKYTMNAAQS